MSNNINKELNYWVGDIVYISPNSKYYGKHATKNPAGKSGTVLDVNYPMDDHKIRVSWDVIGGAHHTNCYRPNDLQLTNPLVNTIIDDGAYEEEL